MKVKIILTSISLVFCHLIFCQGELIITDCVQLSGFDLKFFNKADRMPSDTVVDVKNGYYEIKNDFSILTQVAKFNSKDNAPLLLATGFYSDQQCSNYFTECFKIDAINRKVTPISSYEVFPRLEIKDFLIGNSVIEIIQKYLPAIQKEYLPDGTIEEILEEIYDLHFILPRKGTKITVELTLCDYIPLNVEAFDAADWIKMQTKLKKIELIFDKEIGRFERK